MSRTMTAGKEGVLEEPGNTVMNSPRRMPLQATDKFFMPIYASIGGGQHSVETVRFPMVIEQRA
jgi:hypothetical protein